MTNELEWKTNPIHALRLIRRLSDPNLETNDYGNLVRELHTIADQCLGNSDLIDPASDEPIERHMYWFPE